MSLSREIGRLLSTRAILAICINRKAAYLSPQSLKSNKTSVAFHGGSSHFFGISIYPVSDTAGIGIFWSALLYSKLWREHLFKISQELFF
jgi:hypothetical protein